MPEDITPSSRALHRGILGEVAAHIEDLRRTLDDRLTVAERERLGTIAALVAEAFRPTECDITIGQPPRQHRDSEFLRVLATIEESLHAIDGYPPAKFEARLREVERFAAPYVLTMYHEVRRLERSSDRRTADRLRYEHVISTYLSDCYSRRTAARVSELAILLSAARPYLSRVIPEIFGKPLREVLRDRQLAESCRLLNVTDLPLHEIARASAFGTDVTFHRVFRRAFGMTPAEYRRRQRASGAAATAVKTGSKG
ncbi:MAG TPA: AraC family transcriptional regulator [Thermoanaerobaculia bacterium]|nr:AraC family transcriptional regulator [Thermoanaerobaculia bacterium]